MSGILLKLRSMDFFLISKVGRRVFALFAICLLMPLMALTSFVFFSINRYSASSAQDLIKQRAKNKGLEINARLALADSYLKIISASSVPLSETLPRSIVSRNGPFKLIMIKEEFHKPRVLAGNKYAKFPAIPENGFLHMKEGHAQIAISESGQDIFIVREEISCANGRPCVLIAGMLNPSFLWGEWDCFSKYGELSMAVIDPASGKVLASSFSKEHNYKTEEFVDAALSNKIVFKGHRNTNQFLFSWQFFLKYHYNTGNWIVSSAIPEDFAKAEGRTLKIYFGGFIIFICFITFLISIRFIRKTLIPIKHLRKAAEMIGHGKFDLKIKLHTGDEFEDLADSFNLMTEKLGTLTHELSEEKRQELKRIINISSAVAILWENTEEQPIRFVSDNISSFGYSAQEIYEMKNPLRQILTEEDFTKLQKSINTYMIEEQHSQLNGEYKVRKKDGSEVWVELRLMARRLSGGSISHFEGLMINIEARKKSESDLLAAKEEAEKAYKAKSEFLADMSHEIRTPMNAVIGMTELMSATRLDQEQKEYIDIIMQAGYSLLDIINSVLDISKIEAGKMPVASTVFNLKDSVASTIKSLLFAAAEKDLSITSSTDEKVPEYLKGDPAKLKQIMVNLIGNAIKFTFSGEINVRVELIENSENSAVAKFTVRDTGIGIPEDKKNYIFEKFMQVGSNPADIKGTGLGLPICLKLIKLMNGEIWLDSTSGKGSTFIFKLAFEKPSAYEICLFRDKEEEASIKTEAPCMPQKPLKILAAEDNRVNQKLIKKMLEKEGHTITVAENGREAVHAVREQDFDVILMDIEMPEINGFEAVEIIREDEKTTGKHVRIIALTAYALPGDREKCIEAGMDGYLPKPITRNSLSAALSEN